jgi:hypothetical protein
VPVSLESTDKVEVDAGFSARTGTYGHDCGRGNFCSLVRRAKIGYVRAGGGGGKGPSRSGKKASRPRSIEYLCTQFQLAGGWRRCGREPVVVKTHSPFLCVAPFPSTFGRSDAGVGAYALLPIRNPLVCPAPAPKLAHPHPAL